MALSFSAASRSRASAGAARHDQFFRASVKAMPSRWIAAVFVAFGCGGAAGPSSPAADGVRAYVAGAAQQRPARRLRAAVVRRPQEDQLRRVRAAVEAKRQGARLAGQGARGEPQGQPRRRRARADQLLRRQARAARARGQDLAARERAGEPVARQAAARRHPAVRRGDRAARHHRACSTSSPSAAATA